MLTIMASYCTLIVNDGMSAHIVQNKIEFSDAMFIKEFERDGFSKIIIC